MVRNRAASPQTLLVFDALLEEPDGWHHGYDLSKRTGLPSGTLYTTLFRSAPTPAHVPADRRRAARGADRGGRRQVPRRPPARPARPAEHLLTPPL